MSLLSKLFVVAVIAFAAAQPARAEQIVQLPMDGLLDGRSVSTLTGGAVVNWTDGIDLDDGFMTNAAALSLHQTGPGMPDDGVFPANGDHPEIKLHVTNAAAATSPQSHLLATTGSFQFSVPPAMYSKIFFLLASSYGDAPLSIKLTYADQSTATVTATLPDWGTGKPLPTNPPIFFNLITGLHKWTKAGLSVDTPAHGIIALLVTPAADRALTGIQIGKTTAAPRLTFFGATGVVPSAVDGGARSDGGGEAPTKADASQHADIAGPIDGAVPAADRPATDSGAAGASGGTMASGGAMGNGGTGSSGAAGSAVVPVDGAAGSSGGGGLGVPSHPLSSSGCAIGGRGASPPLGLVLIALALSISTWRRPR